MYAADAGCYIIVTHNNWIGKQIKQVLIGVFHIAIRVFRKNSPTMKYQVSHCVSFLYFIQIESKVIREQKLFFFTKGLMTAAP